MRLKSPRRNNAIGVLDVGTSKTACCIVTAPEPRTGGRWRRDSVRILGFGTNPSRGLKAGVVIDHDGAEQAVRAAVAEAEQDAGVTIDEVFLAVNCSGIQSRTFAADTRINGEPVAISHIARLRAAGRRHVEGDGSMLLHMNALGYRLDGNHSATEPLGMAGSTLAADLHAVTVDDSPLRSLLNVAERAGYEVAGVAPAPYASGLASTTEEERRLGVACIDLGAGTTSLAIFSGGRLLFVDALAAGGHHLTFDIARALSSSFDQAERIKTAYGTLDSAASEDQGLVAYTLAGEEEPTLYQTSKSRLYGLISGRVADVLGRIAERIERSGVGHLAAHVVLTGGASALPGTTGFAEQILSRPVRIAQQHAGTALAAEWCNPQFTTAIGLAQIAFDPGAGMRKTQSIGTPEPRGYVERIGQWLRKGF